ncbi:MAG: hypothetical protein A2622_00525 [Bdellovibrionales bacterium RIFCSPHIGHO2_01_FULL_40_29]|nr:MAG: hypothetical protein A2622_00525 [Bdellovibrionales bacterium RIFCSPHIGHO2_01_FULL_40_29]OFZ32608.1 MAG: hypothetical protein A3D17_05125 [Bdellovibrionales bacterium RIFCSPHIGHO2_02_FULL_40_15]
MKKHILVLVGFLMGSSAFASGGMIGGGEVTLKSLMTCSAQGIDPTHESSSFVVIAKEVDYEGNFVPDATLRVVTMDRNHKPMRFYVTHTAELASHLSIWRYAMGSQGNKKIGQFVWNETTNSGSLTSSFGYEVEELEIFDCILN